MSKEVTKKESTEVSTEAMDMGAWGNREVSAKDIIVPKVLLMQGLSEAVSDEKAKLGDFLYSLDDEVLGGIDKPINFIPFHYERIWIVKHDGEFHHIEPVTAANENMPWEELQGNVQVQNIYCINVYAMLESDLSLPVIIPFKSTSLKAGKKVVTQMDFKNKAAGLIPPAKAMELSATKVKNDKGTYAVLDAKEVRSSSKEEVASAFQWYQAVNAGNVKADDSDLASSEMPTGDVQGDF